MTEPVQESHKGDTGAADQQPMPEISEADLPGAIIAMIFSSTKPTRIGVLASVTGYNARIVRSTIESLEPELQRFGLILQWTDNDHVQLSTSPDHSQIVRRFLGIERTTRLSPAALEVLAIISYRQPVTRPEIDSVRGVDSSGVIQTLVARELIEPVGRLPGPGNPVQFGTTAEFLRVFGLTSLDELPELPAEIVEQLTKSDVPQEEGLDPLRGST
jgi:segregation and condensation protein B